MNKATQSLASQPPIVSSLGSCCTCRGSFFGKHLVAVTEPCLHYFHFSCLAQTINNTLTCPFGCKPIKVLRLLQRLPQDWQEALCTAAANGNSEGVQDILYWKVDPSAGKTGKDTPLQLAIKAMHFDVAKVMLRMGAVDNDTIYEIAWDYEKEEPPVTFFSCLELVAENGHGESGYQLGITHLHGLHGMRKNPSRACYWLETAATSGHGASIVILAGMHRQATVGVSMDSLEIDRLLKQAAENEYVPAIFALAFHYFSGELTGEQDEDQARALLEKGFKKGTSWGLYHYCNMMANGIGRLGDASEVLRWIQCFARRGDACGQFMMGDVCYLGSFGVDRNLEEARQWYVSSARQGNCSAMVSLATMCLQGQGGEGDYGQAVELLADVVEKSLTRVSSCQIHLLSDPRALHSQKLARAQLAELYLQAGMPDGFPIITSKRYAFTLLEGSAKDGCIYAQILLGRINHLGQYSQPRDCNQAIKWFRKAAKAGEHYAVYLNALVYLDRTWLGFNYPRGLLLLKKACGQGVMEAQSLWQQYQERGNSQADPPTPAERPEFAPAVEIRAPTQTSDSADFRVGNILVALSRQLSGKSLLPSDGGPVKRKDDFLPTTAPTSNEEPPATKRQKRKK